MKSFLAEKMAGVEDESVANKINKTSSKTDGHTALQKFLSKLNPKCEALFQYPKKNWRPWDKVWYENRPLGSKQAVNDDEKHQLRGRSLPYLHKPFC